MAKLKKEQPKQVLFEINSYVEYNSVKRADHKLFINREDAILYMVELTRQFESNGLIDGVKRVQKQYHDLDGYLCCIDLFIDCVHVKLIQLSEYKAF